MAKSKGLGLIPGVPPLVETLALIAGGYFLVIKPILQGLNLQDTKEEKAASELQTKTEQAGSSDDYWNGNTYLNKVGYKKHILTSAGASALAKTIYDAQSRWGDDEEAIYGAFRELKYKTQVAFLALKFRELYKQDLYTWLRDTVLNQEELNTVLTITSKLPTGFVKG